MLYPNFPSKSSRKIHLGVQTNEGVWELHDDTIQEFLLSDVLPDTDTMTFVYEDIESHEWYLLKTRRLVRQFLQEITTPTDTRRRFVCRDLTETLNVDT